MLEREETTGASHSLAAPPYTEFGILCKSYNNKKLVFIAIFGTRQGAAVPTDLLDSYRQLPLEDNAN